MTSLKNNRDQRVQSLRDYQLAGVAFLSENTGAALTDEMGLGKTVQVAAAIDQMSTSDEIKRTLIVCPASLKLNWVQELRKWTPNNLAIRITGSVQKRHEDYKVLVPIVVASYEQITRDIDFLSNQAMFDLVVLDEAQRIKNSNSKVSLACKLIPRKFSWALTGTPIENKVSDLLSIFGFAKPGLLEEWMNRGQIHQSMQPHFLRRIKKDVLPELPEMIVQDMELELTPRQRDRYTEVLQAAKGQYTTGNTDSMTHIFAIITALKKICNYDEISDESTKLDATIPIIEDTVSNKKKLIIFSQYVETLRWLSAKFQKRGIVPIMYDGSVSEENRHAALQKFEESTKSEILLISLKAGGAGLNIDSADTVILFDRWWNPAVEAQAMNRAHRFGRDKSLLVYRFLVQNSIESRIDEIIKDKQFIFEQYIEDADVAEIGNFSRAELLGVLGFA